MNVPIDRKTVRMERHVGTETQQSVVEGSLVLPSNLPDIDRIVRLTVHPVITDSSVSDEEVVVNGAVDVVVIYARDEEVVRPVHTPPASPPVPRDADGMGTEPTGGDGTEIVAERGYEVEEETFTPEPVTDEIEVRERLYRQRWRRSSTFEAVLDVPGASLDNVVEVRAEPLDVDVHLHSNGRGVDVEAVVATIVRLTEYDVQQVAVKGKQFHLNSEVAEETIDVEHVFARGTTHISVEGQLPLSTELPAHTVVDLRAVVRVNSGARSDEGDKLTGEGSVTYYAVCADNSGDVDVFAWEAQTPFTFSVDAAGIVEGTPFDVEARVTSLDGAVAANGHGVEVFADIELTARAAEVQSLSVITDIAGKEGEDIRYRSEEFQLERWVGRHAGEHAATGQADLPQGYPPIDRLLDAEARIHVEDVLVLGDKVLVEGQVDVTGSYVARTEGSPVYYVDWNRVIPLEVEVPLAGTEPGMEADVRLNVSDVQLDLLHREAVEVALRFTTDVRVTHPVEQGAVVEAVDVPAPEADPPTLTFIVVQADDTLWKLSHRYHTNVDDIVEANPWLADADTPLPVGRKLCVPRRRSEPATST